MLKNKAVDTVIRALFVFWITTFDATAHILTDNGKEFNNELMKYLGYLFSVKLLSTAAYSPWSNVVCERLNAILAMNVRRIQEDAKCDIHTALSWAVAERNALHNFSGYSPNQLVFTYNLSVPNVILNKPPALEGRVNSEIVADNFNAMHSAREEFISIESNEKIRRALLNQIRSDEMECVCQGDKVYFKREDDQ